MRRLAAAVADDDDDDVAEMTSVQQTVRDVASGKSDTCSANPLATK